MNVSVDLQLVFNSAINVAWNRYHDTITMEHVAYSLVENSAVKAFLAAKKVDVLSVKNSLSKVLDAMPTASRRNNEPKQASNLARILSASFLYAANEGRDKVGCFDMLACIVNSDSDAGDIFRQYKVTQAMIQEHFINNKKTANKKEDEGETDDTIGTNLIDKLTVNLVVKAKEGHIDPLIGRDAEIDRIINVLARRRKNNPILVGESGVGKTAIAEGLALRIAQDEVPACLKEAQVFSLDPGVLIAGTKFRGDLESRMQGLIGELKKHPNAILFIDEIHTLVGAGKTTESGVDVANILKPALNSGELRCIGSTTYKEFQNSFEKDKAFARRFQKIEIGEPSSEDTVKILKGLREKYEEHHGVTYTDAAIKLAVDLSVKYITGKFLPDKAIDVLDEAGATVKLRNKKKTVRTEDVEAVVARIARIPEVTVSSSETAKLENLEAELGRVIFGQDHAIKALATVIKVNRSGLGHPNHPVGSFLFAGPTGVGKTELAKQLSINLGVELIRFDMSEFAEKHTVSKLIGAPPGYVGYNDGGAGLTDAVIKHPRCVLLLDEIEKAHPEIFNILLQVMDNAQLTDNQGRKVDFRNVVLLMTTNAGAFEMESRGIGFGDDIKVADSSQAIKRLFTPEFRNRLDGQIVFSHLSTQTIVSVAIKLIGELEEQLKPKHVQLVLSTSALNWFAEHGYDKRNGARPMGRLIDQTLRLPIANELLFGKLRGGGVVNVDVGVDNQISLECLSKVAVTV